MPRIDRLEFWKILFERVQLPFTPTRPEQISIESEKLYIVEKNVFLPSE